MLSRFSRRRSPLPHDFEQEDQFDQFTQLASSQGIVSILFFELLFLLYLRFIPFPHVTEQGVQDPQLSEIDPEESVADVVDVAVVVSNSGLT